MSQRPSSAPACLRAFGEALRGALDAWPEAFEVSVDLPDELVEVAVGAWREAERQSSPPGETASWTGAALLSLIGLEIDGQRPGPTYLLSADLARDAVRYADERRPLPVSRGPRRR